MGKRVRLRGRRAERDISQMDIAAKTGISVNRYWRIENGYEDPTPDEREAIAKALKAAEAELFPEAVAS